jgi:hypothetical protein
VSESRPQTYNCIIWCVLCRVECLLVTSGDSIRFDSIQAAAGENKAIFFEKLRKKSFNLYKAITPRPRWMPLTRTLVHELALITTLAPTSSLEYVSTLDPAKMRFTPPPARPSPQCPQDLSSLWTAPSPHPMITRRPRRWCCLRCFRSCSRSPSSSPLSAS